MPRLSRSGQGAFAAESLDGFEELPRPLPLHAVPGVGDRHEASVGKGPGHPFSGLAQEEPILGPPDEAHRHLQPGELGVAEGILFAQRPQRRPHRFGAVGEVEQRPSEPQQQGGFLR